MGGGTVRVNVTNSGAPAIGPSFAPAAANTGTTFESSAYNLLPRPGSGGFQIYHRSY